MSLSRYAWTEDKDEVGKMTTPNDKIKFAKARKIKDIYASETSTNYIGGRRGSRSYWNINSREDINELMITAYDQPYRAAEVSKTLVSLDSNYSKIISYYSDMFYIRYLTLPKQQKFIDEVDDETYKQKYDEMVRVVDGLKLEVQIPNILRELFLSGAVYLYGDKYKVAETISYLMLPQQYCRTIFKTNHGTNVIQFDFNYFDKIQNVDERLYILELFPKEFVSLYNESLDPKDTKNEIPSFGGSAGTAKWITLDHRYASSIALNDVGLSPLINALGDIVDYKEFKENNLQKSRNQLKTILASRIPIYEDEPIFLPEEVKAIQEAYTGIVKDSPGLEAVTVFGETELLKLQDEDSKENKQVSQAYKNIYNAVGINPNMVVHDSKDALDYSFDIDKAMIIKYLNLITNYINLTLNNLYNFKPMSGALQLLYITVHNEKKDIAVYRESATYGIGKLHAIVATGVKQIELTDTLRLETFLNLDTLLKPLQSSHTTGQGGDNTVSTNNGKESDKKGNNKDKGKDSKEKTKKETKGT